MDNKDTAVPDTSLKNLILFAKAKESKQKIVKATNEKLKQVLYVVMAPDEVDLHGDITSAEEVRKACQNFNKSTAKANLFHLIETDTFSVIESYIAPTDFTLGTKLVKCGTWLANLQVYSDDVWELIESGDINGVSIKALGLVQSINEETND